MGLDNCNSNLFPSKTVFITARGTVGKIVMAGTEMAMNQTNYALLGKHNVSQYYVYLITLQLVTRLLKKPMVLYSMLLLQEILQMNESLFHLIL